MINGKSAITNIAHHHKNNFLAIIAATAIIALYRANRDEKGAGEMMPNVTDQLESFDRLSLCVRLRGDDPSVCGGEWKINEFHPACTDNEVVISHWCSNSYRMIDREAVK